MLPSLHPEDTDPQPLHGLPGVSCLGVVGNMHFYKLADGSLAAFLVLSAMPYLAFIKDAITGKWSCFDVPYRTDGTQTPGYTSAFSEKDPSSRETATPTFILGWPS